MAEFKITKWTQPETVAFNYEELKAEIEEKAQIYETLVYTDQNIGDAKNDRANLNKLKTALNKERISREKEFMAPFEDFKAKVNEIIGIIDRPIGIIDRQVKDFEESEKAKKRDKIVQIYAESFPPTWLTIGQVWNEKWLNKSVTEKAIKDEIEEKLAKIKSDLDALGKLPEYSFEAVETYKVGLDLGKAIAEGQRLAEIQRKKKEAEAARLKAEEEAALRAAELEKAKPEVKAEEPAEAPAEAPAVAPPEPMPRQWVKFEAHLSTTEAKALKGFFDEFGIEFRAIK